MHARRVRNVAEHLARGAVDHHHVGGARHEHAARGGFDGDVVGAAVAFDVELLDLERLRVPDAGRGEAGCAEQSQHGEHVSGHREPHWLLRSATWKPAEELHRNGDGPEDRRRRCLCRLLLVRVAGNHASGVSRGGFGPGVPRGRVQGALSGAERPPPVALRTLSRAGSVQPGVDAVAASATAPGRRILLCLRPPALQFQQYPAPDRGSVQQAPSARHPPGIDSGPAARTQLGSSSRTSDSGCRRESAVLPFGGGIPRNGAGPRPPGDGGGTHGE